MEFQILDKSSKAGSKRRYSEQGYLVIDDCVLARSGVFEYNAIDFQPRMYNDLPPDAVIRVYRSPETIAEAAPKFSGSPVTSDHPPVMLDALNTRKYQGGHINGDVFTEPDPDHPGEVRMVAGIVVTDATLIASVDTKRQEELSNGYYSRYDFTPGVSPNGEPFDCQQLAFRPNHVAIVEAGRNGYTCRVSDASDLPAVEAKPMSTVTINGVTYEASDQVCQAVATLQAQLAELQGKIPTEEDAAAAEAAAAAQQEEMAALKVELEDAQSMTTPEALDEAVEERQEVVDAARRLVPNFDHKGKSNDTIRREVVKAAGGEIANFDKASTDYVKARFDALAATGGKDSSLSDTLRGAVTKDSARKGETPNVDSARTAAIARRGGAWKKP